MKKSTYEKILEDGERVSVTRLVNFWEVFETNFIITVAPIFVQLLGYFKTMSLFKYKRRIYFLDNFLGNFGYFLFYIWSHLKWLGEKSVSKSEFVCGKIISLQRPIPPKRTDCQNNFNPNSLCLRSSIGAEGTINPLPTYAAKT